MENEKKNGSIFLVTRMRNILASLDSVASAAENQVASVVIPTQTSASSRDKLVCPGDLTQQR